MARANLDDLHFWRNFRYLGGFQEGNQSKYRKTSYQVLIFATPEVLLYHSVNKGELKFPLLSQVPDVVERSQWSDRRDNFFCKLLVLLIAFDKDHTLQKVLLTTNFYLLLHLENIRRDG